MSRKYFPLAVGTVLLTLIMAACGSSGNTTNTGSTSAPTAAPTTASNSQPLVKTTTVTVNGKSETILTDDKGMTLYIYVPDTTTQAKCTSTGGCLTNWPALLAPSSTVTSSTTLPGPLTAVKAANGTQVQYRGHFLYTFAKDTKPGQVNGEGIGNNWFVATPDIKLMTSGPTGGSTTNSQALIHTATATVNGKSETILTDAKGMTLYIYDQDTPTQSNCKGGCLTNWPPELAQGSSTVTSSTSLPGTLSVVNTASGNQIAYQKHLLYTFIRDTAPGQVNGDGVGNVWHVATPSLTMLAASSNPSSGGSSSGGTTTGSYGGYGY